MFEAEWRRKAEEKVKEQKHYLAEPLVHGHPPVPSQILCREWPPKPPPRPSKKRTPH